MLMVSIFTYRVGVGVRLLTDALFLLNLTYSKVTQPSDHTVDLFTAHKRRQSERYHLPPNRNPIELRLFQEAHSPGLPADVAHPME